MLVLYTGEALHESLLAHLGHLLLELEEVLVLNGPVDLLLAHFVLFHVLDKLFLPLLFFDTQESPVVVRVVGVLQLAVFDALELAFGELIEVIEVYLATLSLTIVPEDDSCENSRQLRLLLIMHVLLKLLPHRFICTTDLNIVIGHEAFQVLIMALLVLFRVLPPNSAPLIVVLFVVRTQLCFILDECLHAATVFYLLFHFFFLLFYPFLLAEDVLSIIYVFLFLLLGLSLL